MQKLQKLRDLDPRVDVYLASEVDALLNELNDLCVNASRNHMDIDPEVGRLVRAALGKEGGQ